jgi:hypothetical protein
MMYMVKNILLVFKKMRDESTPKFTTLKLYNYNRSHFKVNT